MDIERVLVAKCLLSDLQQLNLDPVYQRKLTWLKLFVNDLEGEHAKDTD